MAFGRVENIRDWRTPTVKFAIIVCCVRGGDGVVIEVIEVIVADRAVTSRL